MSSFIIMYFPFFVKSKSLSSGKGPIFYQVKKIQDVLQIESICRRQIQHDTNIDFLKIKKYLEPVFSSPEYEVLMVSYCDRAVSVVRRASCVVRRQLFTLCTL